MATRAATRIVRLNGAAVLDKQLREILDKRPARSSRRAPCDCDECSATRKVDYVCQNCGFVGMMFVEPCSCSESHAGEIERTRKYRDRAQRNLGRGKRVEHWIGELAELNGDLAVLEGVDPGACTHDERGTDGCRHGDVWCEVCDGLDHSHAVMLRDIRRVLRAWSLLRDE
ncbi:MAG: hypothetical protein ACHQWU_07645 [Gemmatimonadales bacterium]